MLLGKNRILQYLWWLGSRCDNYNYLQQRCHSSSLYFLLYISRIVSTSQVKRPTSLGSRGSEVCEGKSVWEGSRPEVQNALQECWNVHAGQCSTEVPPEEDILMPQRDIRKTCLEWVYGMEVMRSPSSWQSKLRLPPRTGALLNSLPLQRSNPV